MLYPISFDATAEAVSNMVIYLIFSVQNVRSCLLLPWCQSRWGLLLPTNSYLGCLIACTPAAPLHIAWVCYCWLIKTILTKFFVPCHNQALCRHILCVTQPLHMWRTPSHVVGQAGLPTRSLQSREMPLCCADNKRN